VLHIQEAHSFFIKSIFMIISASAANGY